MTCVSQAIENAIFAHLRVDEKYKNNPEIDPYLAGLDLAFETWVETDRNLSRISATPAEIWEIASEVINMFREYTADDWQYFINNHKFKE